MKPATRTLLRHIPAVAFLALFLAACGPAAPPADVAADHEPVVTELIGLLDSQPEMKASLEAAISTADLQGIEDLPAFLGYLDNLVTFVPTEREVVPECLKFYYIVNQAPGDSLNNDAQFSQWMKHLVRAWGTFLDTPASAAGVDTFMAATNYNIDDYIEGPSGWLTFNQFFAREVKSGRRPVAEPRNDKWWGYFDRLKLIYESDVVYQSQFVAQQDVVFVPPLMPLGEMWARGASLKTIVREIQNPTDLSGDIVGAFRRAKDLVGQLRSVYEEDEDRRAELTQLIRAVSRDEVEVID